jgi:hypothetical protein
MAGRAKIVRGKSAGRGKGNAKLTKGIACNQICFRADGCSAADQRSLY